MGKSELGHWYDVSSDAAPGIPHTTVSLQREATVKVINEEHGFSQDENNTHVPNWLESENAPKSGVSEAASTPLSSLRLLQEGVASSRPDVVETEATEGGSVGVEISKILTMVSYILGPYRSNTTLIRLSSLIVPTESKLFVCFWVWRRPSTVSVQQWITT